MRRTWLSIVGLASLAIAHLVLVLPAPAQAQKATQVRPRSQQFQGQIVEKGTDKLVIKTRDKDRVTFHINPRTKFVLNDKVVKLEDLRVQSNVKIVSVLEDDRQVAETVTLIADEAAPAEGTLIEGEIVRVVGDDQVVVRTPERKEVIVFVDKQTTFQLDNKAAKFADLQRGHNVRVNVDVRDGRHTARQIVVPPRRR